MFTFNHHMYTQRLFFLIITKTSGSRLHKERLHPEKNVLQVPESSRRRSVGNRNLNPSIIFLTVVAVWRFPSVQP